jgi:molecular chaperone DnaK
MTINFGIDLGTTNSVIAKFDNGKVRIYKDKISLKDTVPSTVFFRDDRIIVGAKAKERMERDAQNVYGSFKRRMGTSETYLVPATGDFVRPIDLSAHVLKHLKTLAEETVDAAIITIPASFDTIQSNATKEAGKLAGFDQVLLLQEPIAASLAFANQEEDRLEEEGQWLVYDLGGGTFDVALVRIKDGEMKVIDHEGNNFLGGIDFDFKILDQLIIPEIEKRGQFNNLAKEMKQASGKHNLAYFKCMHQAEKAKIELSSSEVAEIEILMNDDDGNPVDLFLEIHRHQFEALIKDAVEETVQLSKDILKRNELEAEDLQSVILVGGSTFIPYVRQRLAQAISTKVDASLDPTAVVAIGAAYYAGTQTKKVEPKESKSTVSDFQIKLAYPKTSQETEEFFAAKVEGETDGCFYRITRLDGGFDTGLKKLSRQIAEDLPLVKNAHNFFQLELFDHQNNKLETGVEPFGITQGKFSIEGQPLPNDICLEVDDPDHGGTTLDLIFKKNLVLPMRKTKIYPLKKDLAKGNPNDRIIINVVEGPSYAMPEACQTIGFIQIKGSDLERSVAKGSDLEISLKISESRDLQVAVYLGMADQEFTEVFTPTERSTPITELKDQVKSLEDKLRVELQNAEKKEWYEEATRLNGLLTEADMINKELGNVNDEDVSDKRYQLEDRKRKVALQVDQITKKKRVDAAKSDYTRILNWSSPIVNRFGNSQERRIFNEIQDQEASFLAGGNTKKIKDKTEELRSLASTICWRTPELLIRMFYDLSADINFASFSNTDRARSLITDGKYALDQQNWQELARVNAGLIGLLPGNMSTQFGGGRTVGF